MSRLTKFILDGGATVTTTFSGTHCLGILCVVNLKLIGTKKNKKIWEKHLEMVQTHFIEPSSDEDVIIGSFLTMSIDKDANTLNRKDCPEYPREGEKQITEKCSNA